LSEREMKREMGKVGRKGGRDSPAARSPLLLVGKRAGAAHASPPTEGKGG
jgi:hypothetical protein